jgi:hypothetical protein
VPRFPKEPAKAAAEAAEEVAEAARAALSEGLRAPGPRLTLATVHCASAPEDRETAVAKARPARAVDLNRPWIAKDKVFTTSTPENLELGRKWRKAGAEGRGQ